MPTYQATVVADVRSHFFVTVDAADESEARDLLLKGEWFEVVDVETEDQLLGDVEVRDLEEI